MGVKTEGKMTKKKRKGNQTHAHTVASSPFQIQFLLDFLLPLPIFLGLLLPLKLCGAPFLPKKRERQFFSLKGEERDEKVEWTYIK